MDKLELTGTFKIEGDEIELPTSYLSNEEIAKLPLPKVVVSSMKPNELIRALKDKGVHINLEECRARLPIYYNEEVTKRLKVALASSFFSPREVNIDALVHLEAAVSPIPYHAWMSDVPRVVPSVKLGELGEGVAAAGYHLSSEDGFSIDLENYFKEPREYLILRSTPIAHIGIDGTVTVTRDFGEVNGARTELLKERMQSIEEVIRVLYAPLVKEALRPAYR